MSKRLYERMASVCLVSLKARTEKDLQHLASSISKMYADAIETKVDDLSLTFESFHSQEHPDIPEGRFILTGMQEED